MKTIQQMTLTLLLLIAATACRKEESSAAETDGAPNQAHVYITINVEQEAAVATRSEPPAQQTDSTSATVTTCMPTPAWGEAETRSTTTAPNESDIKDLWALQFDEGGTLVGNPIYKEGLSGLSTVTLMLTQTAAGKEHTVHFVTNTGNPTLFTADNAPTLQRLEALRHRFATEASVTSNGLLMTGSYTGVLKDKAKIATPIEMKRAVAKIAFTYNTGNFRDGSFKVLSVQLKNVPVVSSYLLPSPLPTAYPTGSGNSHADYAPEAQPHATNGTCTWYLPENVRGSNPAISWEGDKSRKNIPAGQESYATFIQIGGVATLTDGTEKNMLYQFYIGNTLPEYNIRRNTIYTVGVDILGIDENDQRVTVDVSTPVLATESTVDPASITGSGATATATIVSDGGSPLTEKGFYLSAQEGFYPGDAGVITAPTRALTDMGTWPPPLPTTRAFVPIPFSTTFTGLGLNKTYYIRPYATNGFGTTVGQQVSFITNGKPTLGATTVGLITVSSAQVSYTITNIGAGAIREKGVLYSQTRGFDPTPSGTVWKATGESPIPLTGLTHGTTYYVRAFARNDEGTSYSPEVTFTTLTPPSFGGVKMLYVAGANGYVRVEGSVSKGSENLTERGVMWSTASFTDPANGNAQLGSGSGNDFTAKIKTTSPSWYLYPYAMASGNVPYYGTTQYNHTQVPTPGDGITLTYVTGSRTVASGAAPSSTGSGSIISRGFKWDVKSGFDPASEGTTVTPVGSDNFTNADFSPPSPPFYLRTYATNSNGHTTYGGQLSVTLWATPPEIWESSQKIYSEEGLFLTYIKQAEPSGSVTETGLIYSKESGFDPLTEGKTLIGTPTGVSIRLTATILQELTYLRFYAKMSNGHVVYGPQIKSNHNYYVKFPIFSYTYWLNYSTTIIRTEIADGTKDYRTYCTTTYPGNRLATKAEIAEYCRMNLGLYDNIIDSSGGVTLKDATYIADHKKVPSSITYFTMRCVRTFDP